jgi:(5-formylfuran-3-yl)methyl phosphate transaminase
MISQRAGKIPPFLVMDILERAQELERQGNNIIHLKVGEPDFETPIKIKNAALRAIKTNETHYTHSLGILQLREAIAGHYKIKYNVDVSPDQVIVTMGTSPALHLVLTALLNPGVEVILSDPCYACYPNFVRFVDGVPVGISVYGEDNYALDVDCVKIRTNKKTMAILINSPSNPTGSMLSAQNMKGLANLDTCIISDEIYHGLVYGGKEHLF